jgi:four helix bundle protein
MATLVLWGIRIAVKIGGPDLTTFTSRRFYVKYKRFEELPVWNDAIRLSVRIFSLTSRSELKPYRSIRDQIERAAMSVSNNIAEGFERGTTQETLTFLYIAKGSCGETRSILCLCERLFTIPIQSQDNLRSEISDLKSSAESISRQLRAWCNSLQNSAIRGQRYLTDKSRRAEQAAREREEFLRELEAIRTGRS